MCSFVVQVVEDSSSETHRWVNPCQMIQLTVNIQCAYDCIECSISADLF